MAASLELSYRYLTQEQQRLFRRRFIRGTDFSAYAAAAAAGCESLATAEQALEALLDHHLLEECDSGRFSFHDLIHEYAYHLALREDAESDRRRSIHRMLDY